MFTRLFLTAEPRTINWNTALAAPLAVLVLLIIAIAAAGIELGWVWSGGWAFVLGWLAIVYGLTRWLNARSPRLRLVWLVALASVLPLLALYAFPLALIGLGVVGGGSPRWARIVVGRVHFDGQGLRAGHGAARPRSDRPTYAP